MPVKVETIFLWIILYIKQTKYIYYFTRCFMKRTKEIAIRRPDISVSPDAAWVTVEQRSCGGNYILGLPLYPHAVEFALRNTTHWFKTVYGVHLQVVYIPEGKLRYRYENRSVVLSGNRVLIMPPGKAYSFETLPGCCYKKNVLFINGVNLPDILETFNFDKVTLLTLPDLEQLNIFFKEIYDLMEDQGRGHLPQLSGKSLELLQYLSAFNKGQGASPLLFTLIKNYIGHRFSSDWEIKHLAEEFKVSVRTINRMFNKYLQMTPLQYRQQCRFKAACEFLERSDFSIKEIADQLGYCNQFHFSKEFTRFAGMPPRQYRQKAGEK